MRDLYELSRQEGADRVAEAMGVTVRALRDIRRGHHALTVDHLYRLPRAFADFDMGRTVEEIGRARVVRRRPRWFRRQRPGGRGE